MRTGCSLHPPRGPSDCGHHQRTHSVMEKSSLSTHLTEGHTRGSRRSQQGHNLFKIQNKTGLNIVCSHCYAQRARVVATAPQARKRSLLPGAAREARDLPERHFKAPSRGSAGQRQGSSRPRAIVLCAEQHGSPQPSWRVCLPDHAQGQGLAYCTTRHSIFSPK